MEVQTRTLTCPHCQYTGPVEKKTISHGLHIALSVVTVGTWLFVYLPLLWLRNGKARCPSCNADITGHFQAQGIINAGALAVNVGHLVKERAAEQREQPPKWGPPS